MMWYKSLVVLVLILMEINSELIGGRAKCGVKICSPLEFCSKFHNICEPCSNVCEPSHNYDETRCMEDCRSYHLNLLQQSDNKMQAEIRSLRLMVIISLTLTCFLLVCFTIAFVMKRLFKTEHQLTMKWLRNKFKTKEKQKPDSSVAVTVSSGKPDLRLEMPPMQTPSVTGNTPTTATTTLSRRPTEDSTLDYAYDNPAMASTPSPVKPHESTL